MSFFRLRVHFYLCFAAFVPLLRVWKRLLVWEQVARRPKAANVANTQNTLMSAWCGQHSWYVVQCTIFTHVVTVHSWPDHVLPTILSQKPTLPITYDIAANMLTASLLGVRSPCGQNRLLV